MRTALPLIALVVGLAACSGQSATHSGSSGAARHPAASSPVPVTSTPSPSRSLIAVADDAGAGRTTFSLVTLDGGQVAHVTLPQSTEPWPGVGGGMLTFVDQGQLKGLTPSGNVETLGPVAGYNGGPAVVSPDGQRWMWGTTSFANGAETSKLMLGARGSPDRAIAQET